MKQPWHDGRGVNLIRLNLMEKRQCQSFRNTKRALCLPTIRVPHIESQRRRVAHGAVIRAGISSVQQWHRNDVFEGRCKHYFAEVDIPRVELSQGTLKQGIHSSLT